MKKEKQKFNNTPGSLRQVLYACLLASTLLSFAGCHPGMIAVLTTPTRAEMENTAEYDLAAEKNKKILILVDQPAFLHTSANMRFLLTDATCKMLLDRLKIKPEMLIDYDSLADFRANTTDFSLLSPEEVGAALKADFVLFIVITDCTIADLGQSGSASGFLTAQAELVNVADGRRLWPADEKGRVIKVGFESESRGPDAAAVRLAVDAAHCVTRYLYNCPENQFKISDESKDIGWESKPASGG